MQESRQFRYGQTESSLPPQALLSANMLLSDQLHHRDRREGRAITWNPAWYQPWVLCCDSPSFDDLSSTSVSSLMRQASPASLPQTVPLHGD
jgi:hypothetical protein